MMEIPKAKTRRRPQFLRRLTLLMMRLGLTSETIAYLGMGLGILGGIAFMATGETIHSRLAWGIGAAMCLLRTLAIRLDFLLQPNSVRQSREEEFYNELPERVSDSLAVIGFGFAVDSSPWLGLAAALSAILSAYVRSFTSARFGGRRPGGLVLMTRSQRLVLLSIASVLMILEAPHPAAGAEIPKIALSLVIMGCLFTVFLRWIALRGIKV